MKFATLIPVLLAAAPALAQTGSTGTGPANNVTSLVGTWSSGSQAVQTGLAFANPANMSFTYPKTAGISYSFTGDGYYEIARYRYNSNGSQPTCITGVIGWVHGTYQLNPNGSISMTPFGDGYQQIQDPCAAVSNFIENYNRTELYQSWQIFQDTVTGYKLHLFQFDGAPLAPMFQVATSPNMLPTQMLRNVTAPLAPTVPLKKRTNGVASNWSAASSAGLAIGVFGLGVASILL